MAIRDNKDYIKVLLYSSYTTITGLGGPPKLYRDNGKESGSYYFEV